VLGTLSDAVAGYAAMALDLGLTPERMQREEAALRASIMLIVRTGGDMRTPTPTTSTAEVALFDSWALLLERTQAAGRLYHIEEWQPARALLVEQSSPLMWSLSPVANRLLVVSALCNVFRVLLVWINHVRVDVVNRRMRRMGAEVHVHGFMYERSMFEGWLQRQPIAANHLVGTRAAIARALANGTEELRTLARAGHTSRGVHEVHRAVVLEALCFIPTVGDGGEDVYPEILRLDALQLDCMREAIFNAAVVGKEGEDDKVEAYLGAITLVEDALRGRKTLSSMLLSMEEEEGEEEVAFLERLFGIVDRLAAVVALNRTVHAALLERLVLEEAWRIA
jgi:hypothetical protein